MLPAVAFPGIVARLSGSRNCIGLPNPLAGGQVEGLDRTAYAIFAACKAGDYKILGDRRRRGDRRTLFVVY
jgi:hypothetical protein